MAAHPMPHPGTILHLEPVNQAARDALLHPDNVRFVSSFRGCPLGLEVGFHVSSMPRGHVVAQLGRNADLTLRQTTPLDPVSAVHVSFDINPSTHNMILNVRSRRQMSVTFQPLVKPGKSAERAVTGGGVLVFGTKYRIAIASYLFDLKWRSPSAGFLRGLVMDNLRLSLQRVQDMRSRDRPTDVDVSEAQSWHITRLGTASQPQFQDVEHLREPVGSGTFGVVYRAIDQATGNRFAIKVVNLAATVGLEVGEARALLHREIKVLERVRHANIVEYLGSKHFHTMQPEILMPLRDGSLTLLIETQGATLDLEKLSQAALEQILYALDYLANKRLIHRDVKSENILFTARSDGSFHFQLADFGLANHPKLATTVCGTIFYRAPELLPWSSGIFADQSSKLDVWSLFATIVAIYSAFREFPPSTNQFRRIVHVLRDKACQSERLEPMGRLHPDRRASAAQMLLRVFGGRGLTTPLAEILPIEPSDI